MNDKYTYSPQPQLGASDPLSRLTAVYVYTFTILIYFLPKLTSFLPPTPPPQKKNTQTAPLISDKALAVQL